ncbi:carbohydrate-binding module family 13 protein [Amanita muscaria]
MTAASNNDGALVTIQTCTGGASQTWVFTNGEVRVFGNKCLDVTNGGNYDGNKLQIWTCYNGDTNQQWYYDIWSNQLSWTNHGKCADLTTGNLADGNQPSLSVQDTQSGYNACGTGSSQTSLCQTAWIKMILANGGTIGDTERDEVAWCTRSGRGTRTIPDGTLQGVHFVKTPDYVQVTGVGDFTHLDGKGNPVGGLVFGNSFGTALQYHEWTSFISDSEFCFRACVGPQATVYCNHIYDVMGCYWNMPANYDAGYLRIASATMTSPWAFTEQAPWYQGVNPTPPAQPAASSSNCQSLPTVSVTPANRKRDLEYKRAAAPAITPQVIMEAFVRSMSEFSHLLKIMFVPPISNVVHVVAVTLEELDDAKLIYMQLGYMWQVFIASSARSWLGFMPLALYLWDDIPAETSQPSRIVARSDLEASGVD